MALPMAALAKVGVIAAHHSPTPVVAALLWPFLLKFSLTCRPLRQGCTDLLDAMRLFLFQMGHILFDGEPVVGPAGGRRWRRAVRLLCERKFRKWDPPDRPNIYQLGFILLPLISLQTSTFLGRCANPRRRESSPPKEFSHAVAQDIHDKEEVGEEAEAEQAHSLLDPHAHRQHHPLQRQAPSLAPHQARLLNMLGLVPPSLFPSFFSLRFVCMRS